VSKPKKADWPATIENIAVQATHNTGDQPSPVNVPRM
jgi:hypothetical protein